MRRLKTTQVAGVRLQMLDEQGGRCAMCQQPTSPAQAVLDHCHKTGFVRATLCRNCNGIEGKIKNLAARGKRMYDETWFLKQLLRYWDTHNDTIPSHGLLHPTHRTDDEKRIRRNALARKRRAASKPDAEYGPCV